MIREEIYEVMKWKATLLILRVVYGISTASGNKNENKRIYVKEQRYLQMCKS